MVYGELAHWVRLFDLIANRVGVINQTLGARYDYCASNACHVAYSDGRYVCEVCGARFADFGLYDIPSAEDALSRLDSLNDGLWLLNRSGRLSFT